VVLLFSQALPLAGCLASKQLPSLVVLELQTGPAGGATGIHRTLDTNVITNLKSFSLNPGEVFFEYTTTFLIVYTAHEQPFTSCGIGEAKIWMFHQL